MSERNPHVDRFHEWVFQPATARDDFPALLAADPALLASAKAEHRRLSDLDTALGGQLEKRCVISHRTLLALTEALQQAEAS